MVTHFWFRWTVTKVTLCLGPTAALWLKLEQEINHLQSWWRMKIPMQSMCQAGSASDVQSRFQGVLLHMQHKLYKPPASQAGGTSDSSSCKHHFYFLKVLAKSLRDGLRSGRFGPWSNGKCSETLSKAAAV